MRLRAIIGQDRVPPVEGIPIPELREAADRVEEVHLYNGPILLETIPGPDLRRRIRIWPDDWQAAMMAEPTHGDRFFPVSTAYRHDETGRTLNLVCEYDD